MAVTVDDVAVSLGRTPPADGSIDALRWAMWIKDALFLIEARPCARKVATKWHSA